MNFSKIEHAISDIKRGKFVIIVDDENRENEGDLVIAAEKVTPAKVNFMLKHARGLICVPLTSKRLGELKLPLMIDRDDRSMTKCAFTVSIDYKIGTSTGTSAFDRAHTIMALSNSNINAEDFSKPGHVFPLRCRDGGILEREGHTEASVELAKLAGLSPSSVICEILNDDGTMAKLDNVFEFSKQHNDMKVISINDLIEYKKKLDSEVKVQEEVKTEAVSV